MNPSQNSTRRDAWAVIRGYLYQIRNTVLRWIDLDDETTLLCETGEDLTQVGKMIDPTSGEVLSDRITEQVKHIERHITLRSSAILQTLANFYNELNTSKDAARRLRFTTTAVAGLEQGVQFPQGLTGIDACSRISWRVAGFEEAKATARAFQVIIVDTEPSFSSQKQRETYGSFKEFVSTASETDLMRFLESIEWAIGQPGPDLLRDHIEERLVSKGLVSSSAAAAATDKLTVHVLDTLSKPGLKVLNRETLHKVLSNLELAPSERVILDRLSSLEDQLIRVLAEIGHRVRRIDENVVRLDDPITQTRGDVGQILAILQSTGLGGQPVRLEFALPIIDDQPMSPRHHLQRRSLLKALEEFGKSATWIHIQGGAGIGKTHLARDFGEHVQPRQVVWISLSGQDTESEMVQHLNDQVCANLVKITRDTSWWQAYRTGQASATGLLESLVRIADRSYITIIDDIPDDATHPRLRERLGILARACGRVGSLMVTTSQRELAPSTVAILAVDKVTTYHVAPMDSSEILSLLTIAGAPPRLLSSQFGELLIGTTRGYPSLIAATVYWLEANRWDLDQTGLLEILTGTPTADERESSVRRMVALVSDGSQRQLLCRLSLIGRTFERAFVDVVAGAAPVLSRPGELLGQLIGPWVNRLGGNRFEVSPLVADAGRIHLSRDEQQRIHDSIAHHILSRDVLEADQAFHALIHLYAAGQLVRFAIMFIRILTSARTRAHAQQLAFLRFLFPPGDWPTEIPLPQRIMVRGLQVRITRLAGEDARDLEQDLERLVQSIGEAPGEIASAISALMLSGPLSSASPPSLAAKYAVLAFRLMHHHPELFQGSPGFLENEKDIVWLTTVRVLGAEDVDSYIEALDLLSTQEVRVTAESSLMLQASEILANKTWVEMSTRPQEKQDWKTVLATLDRFENFGRKHGLDNLKFVARRARAIVLADYLGKSNEALDLLRAEEPADPNVLFLNRYTIARILDENNDLEQCLPAYENALISTGDEFTFYRFSAYANAAEAAGRLGLWSKSSSIARAGIRYAKAINKLEGS